MTQEGKNELYQYLCCCLPYDVKVDLFGETKELVGLDNSFPPTALVGYDINGCEPAPIEDIKPYLRPIESMTEEERKEFSKLLDKRYCEEDWEGHISVSYCIEVEGVYIDDEDGIKWPSSFSMNAIDWLNVRHFDYRGLIEKGLAIEAPEGIYKTEQS